MGRLESTDKTGYKSLLERTQTRGVEISSIIRPVNPDYVPGAERVARDIELGQTMSLYTLATSLLRDATSTNFTSRSFPMQVQTLQKEGEPKFGNGLPLAPLATVVAEAELEKLGIRDIVALRRDGTIELLATISAELKPGRKKGFNTEELQERRAVIGYQWLKSPEISNLGNLIKGLDTTVKRSKKAKDDLIKENIDITIESRFANASEDIKQVAKMGLTKAAYKFDWRKGFSFPTYAGTQIDREIDHYYRDLYSTLKKSRRYYDVQGIIDRATAELTRKGIQATPENIAIFADLSLERVEGSLRYDIIGRNLDSLDRLITNENGKREPLGELLPLRSGVMQEGIEVDIATASIDHLLLIQGIKSLKPREREIMIDYYFKNIPQSAIGRRYGISQMHVYRLLTQSVKKLREIFLAED